MLLETKKLLAELRSEAAVTANAAVLRFKIANGKTELTAEERAAICLTSGVQIDGVNIDANHELIITFEDVNIAWMGNQFRITEIVDPRYTQAQQRVIDG